MKRSVILDLVSALEMGDNMGTCCNPVTGESRDLEYEVYPVTGTAKIVELESGMKLEDVLTDYAEDVSEMLSNEGYFMDGSVVERDQFGIKRVRLVVARYDKQLQDELTYEKLAAKSGSQDSGRAEVEDDKQFA